MLVRALMLREKYMILSGQTFPQVTGRFLASLDGEEAFDALSAGLSKVTSLEGEMQEFAGRERLFKLLIFDQLWMNQRVSNKDF